MNISANDLQLAVAAAELAARLLPGAIEIGANLVNAIRSCAELSDEDKAALVARVEKTQAAVRAYRPLPHPGSPSV